MSNKSAHTRVQILQAASSLIVKEGIEHLTLDAIAAAAHVSKGGLLYHYPSKDALVMGMIDFYVQQFEEQFSTFLTEEPDNDTPEAWIRAYIRASLEPVPGEADVSAGIMAAVAINPALLDPLRERYRKWQHQFDQASNPALALLVRLTLDGWWIANLLGLAPTSEADRVQLYATLLKLIEERK